MKANSKAFKASIILALAACALVLPSAPARAVRQSETRGVNIRLGDGKDLRLYERSYALVIGVGDYAGGWPKLPGVRRDIEAVSVALEKHGFQVTKTENPDSAQLDKAFKTFIDEHGVNVENRLLFYFAGHGHTVKQSYGEEMGYIVPTDAPLPSRDLAGFMSKAMDMQQMELYARRIQSKHALFLFDSCFSGAIFALARAVPDAITYKTARPVRQFITSGSADETVPDQSIFRRQFVEALEGEADLNHDEYVTGTELGMFLQDKVINYSKNTQHPQYGKLRNPNLDKGDFVFALPRMPKPITLAAPLADVKPVPPALVNPDAVTSPSMGKGGTLPARPVPRAAVRAGIELVYIPPGSFMMGSENGDTDEQPVHRVKIRKGFYMGKYEVTQAQWRAVMGENRSLFRGDDLPVDGVSWNTAQVFVNRLNETNDGYTYRLPTEAEWEYACRAGMAGSYSGDPDEVAWYYANAGDMPLGGERDYETQKANNNRTHPVGQKSPNAFGLFDMHGNVWEWCQDLYHSSYVGAPKNGSAWLSGSAQGERVLRGGSWNDNADSLRSTNRYWLYVNNGLNYNGLRVVAVARQ